MIQRIKQKIKDFYDDPHMQEVARGTALAFVLRILGASLTFGFNIAVARLLGAEGTGLYFLALSVTTIASVIGRIGLDNALLRFIATHVSQDEWNKVHGVYALGIRLAVLASAIMSIGVFVLAPWFTETLFSKPELSEPLRWMALSILPFAVLNLQAESFKGAKKIRNAMLIQGIGVPLFGLLLIWPLTQWFAVNGVAMGYTLSTLLVAMLGVWAWRQSVPTVNSKDKFPLPVLWGSCKHLFVISVINRGLLPWAPIMLLGVWVASESLAIFGAATRVSLLISFMLFTVNNVVAPKFAELYAANKRQALASTARKSAIFLTLLVTPLFIALFLFSHQIMQLFGSEFASGGDILSILLIGPFIGVACGPVGFLLMMSGHEKIYRNITIFSMLIQLLLLMLLTPLMGITGAAIAASISLACMSLMAVYMVKKKLGFITIPMISRFFTD